MQKLLPTKLFSIVKASPTRGQFAPHKLSQGHMPLARLKVPTTKCCLHFHAKANTQILEH